MKKRIVFFSSRVLHVVLESQGESFRMLREHPPGAAAVAHPRNPAAKSQSIPHQVNPLKRYTTERCIKELKVMEL